MSSWRYFWKTIRQQALPRRAFASSASRVGARGLSLLLAGCCGVSVAQAQLEVLSNAEPHAVFAGGVRRVPVVLRNPGRDPVEFAGVMRLLQTSSSTAAPLSETNWKTVRVLAGQTILESAELTFPAVKSETRFLIQWADASRKVIGSTEVLVYPTNLLSALKTLTADQPLGVFDPQDQLKPLLKAVGVEFEDLADRELDSFTGPLAIIGPFASSEEISGGLTERISKLTDKGVAVVWIQPPPKKSARLKPDFYSVPIGKGIVVIVQARLCSDLANNPVAQVNLIQLAQLAVHPEPTGLPSFTR